MSFYATVAIVVSTAITAYGQAQQAQAVEQAAEYNNQLAQQEATNIELENMEQIKRKREADRRALSEVRARLANNGTLSTEGTPLAILGESSAMFELEIMDMARRANMAAASVRAEGAMGLWEGEQQSDGLKLQAAATAVSGVGSAYSYYSKNKPSTAPAGTTTPGRTGV
jgi:hypothetical protein